ncbi:unnamed protein product [Ixodes hexagonus]
MVAWIAWASTLELRVVPTSLGLVVGRQLCKRQYCADAFLGIPFAEPPVGPRRFKRPVRKKPWRGLFYATQLPRPCFQRRGRVPPVPWQADEKRSREDCLYLNIWVPAIRPWFTRLPVMVWIYGGSYRIGGSDLDLYDGTTLSDCGRVIVVSFNYRLGAFGFLNANVTDIPGNMGLWDQYAAVRWVSENIASFGGDPSRVTLFGESVGGASVGMLAQSPLSRGLVRRIIMQSGTPRWPLPLENDGGVKRALGLARNVGCLRNEESSFHVEALNCLQRVPAEDIAQAELELFDDHLFTFMPSYGDELVPVDPVTASKGGRILPLDVLMGINSREGAIVYYAGSGAGLPKNWTSDGIDMNSARSFMAQFFGAFPEEIVDEIVAYYLGQLRDSSSRKIFAAMSAAAGNFLFNCPAVFMADALAGWLPRLWTYKFQHRATASPWPQEFDVTHSDGIQFVFGVPLRCPEKYSRDDARISEITLRAWAAFAHTGYPELPNGVLWPVYEPKRSPYVSFQHASVAAKSGLDGGNCMFWKKFI